MSGNKPISRGAGVVFITLTLLGWGTVLLFLKHLAAYIDPWTANGWRYSIAAVFWLPILVMGAARGALPAGLWRRALIPAVLNVAGQILYAFAPYYIGPGLAGFLLRVSLISSTAGALFFFVDERPLARNPLFWVGMGLIAGGTLGTVLLGTTPLAGASGFGVAAGLLSGAFFGLYGVSVRYYMRGIPSMTAFAAISLYTACGMVVLMLPLGDQHGLRVFQLSGYNWFLLITSSMVGIAIGHTCYYAAIARLGVAVSTAIVQVAPFIGGIGAVVLFRETLTIEQWASGFVMLGGAWLLLRAEQARHLSAAPVFATDREQPAFAMPLEDAGGSASLAAADAVVVDQGATPVHSRRISKERPE